MASFDEVSFDSGVIEYGTVGGAMFKTNVVVIDSGQEQRTQVWQNGRGRWEVGERTLLQTDMQTINTFFRARLGRARGFRWRDWADYTVTTANGTVGPSGLGNGTAGPFQLIKNYGDAGNTYQRNIRKPVSGSVTIYKNGTAQTSGTNYTLDVTTGLVTFITPFPASTDVLTWAGQFDVPVRFDTDELKYRITAATGVAGTTNTGAQVWVDLMSLPILEIIV